MILSKSQLVNNINSEISDQSYGQISPYDIRHNLLDIIDSIHNLTLSNELKSLNFSTFAPGNTRVGQLALDNVSIDGSISSDNTAIGYYSLRSNYQGIKNTAIGSNALSCNVYGEGNVALGYQSLAGNTVGHLNIGIGNFSLNNSKSGAGNIAIGHGAGYYADKDSYHKLFIAYHPVNEQHICDNPTGSGFIPLLYGDLSGIKLGIGTRTLNNQGVLQVAGNIVSSSASTNSLGTPALQWNSLFVNSGIYINNYGMLYSTSGIEIVNADIYPTSNNSFSLGLFQRKWKNGYFNHIVADSANITYLNALHTYLYSGANIFLNVDDQNKPLLNDDNIIGGGVILKSSNAGSQVEKNYSLTVLPPSSGFSSFAGDYNATWFSSINLRVPSGSYIQTNNIVSYNPSNLSDSDCFGLFFESGITYFSRKNVLKVNPISSAGHIAGISNINFISNSGEVKDYSVAISSLESGVSVSQKFLNGTKSRIKDIANSNKDKLRGFEIKYVDDSLLNVQGPLTDRLVVGSYNNTSQFVNSFTLLKYSQDGSAFGITNIPNSDSILPDTIFNVRSKDNCIARFSAEASAGFKSAVQLLGSSNCLCSGLEISYLNNSGIVDFTLYDNVSGANFIRFRNKQIGLLSSGILNEVITIGHSGMHKLPAISLKDDTFVSDSNIVPSSGYAKLFAKRVERLHANQYNTIFLLDCSGNSLDLSVNKLDNIDARAIYTDASGNTYGGYLSPSGRKFITEKTKDNTSYGNKALYSIDSGSGNIAFGSESLYNLTSGNNNIAIGQNAGSGLINSSNNIIIGNKAFNKSTTLSTTSGNIIIGHNVGSSISGSYNFLLGLNENTILLEGKLGPTNNDKMLVLPSGGKLYIHNNDNTESLSIRPNIIEVIDSGGSDFPENELLFKFTGNKSANLLTLNHVASSSVYSPSWSHPSYIIGNFGGLDYYNNFWFPTSGLLTDLTPKPYAQLNGNLRLNGNIQFADGTYLGSTKQISINTDLANSGISLGNSGISIGNSGIQRLNSLFIEGFVQSNIPAPSAGQKTSGIMILKDQFWADSGLIFVTNRDSTSVIHSGAYVVAAKINNEYRPIWISAADTFCCET